MQENDTRPDPGVLLARLKAAAESSEFIWATRPVSERHIPCCRPPMRLRTAEKTWQQVT